MIGGWNWLWTVSVASFGINDVGTLGYTATELVCYILR
jgi:hypothetical protein